MDVMGQMGVMVMVQVVGWWCGMVFLMIVFGGLVLVWIVMFVIIVMVVVWNVCDLVWQEIDSVFCLVSVVVILWFLILFQWQDMMVQVVMIVFDICNQCYVIVELCDVKGQFVVLFGFDGCVVCVLDWFVCLLCFEL